MTQKHLVPYDLIERCETTSLHQIEFLYSFLKGLGPKRSPSKDRITVAVLEEDPDSGRVRIASSDDLPELPEDYEEFDSENPGNWGILLKSSSSRNDSPASYIMMSKLCGLIPEDVTKVLVSRSVTRTTLHNMPLLLANEGVFLLGDLDGTSGVAYDPLRGNGYLEDYDLQPWSPGRRNVSESRDAIGDVPIDLASLYGEEELESAAVYTLALALNVPAVRRKSMLNQKEKDGALESINGILQNISLGLLSLNEQQEHSFMSVELEVPFTSYILPENVTGRVSAINIIRHRATALLWAWKTYSAKIGIEERVHNFKVGRSLLELATESGFAEVIRSIALGECEGPQAILAAVAPFAAPKNTFSISIASAESENAAYRIATEDELECFKYDSQHYMLRSTGPRSRNAIPPTPTAQTDAITRVLAKEVSMATTATGKPAETPPVAFIDVRQGYNAVVFNYPVRSRGRINDVAEVDNKIGSGDWGLATFRCDCVENDKDVSNLQTLGLALIATGRVDPAKVSKLAVIGGNWIGFNDRTTKRLTERLSGNGVSHIADDTGLFKDAPQVAKDMLVDTYKMGTKTPNSPLVPGRPKVGLAYGAEVAPYIAEKVAPLITAKLVQDVFSSVSPQLRRTFPTDVITGEFLEALSFGQREASQYPLGAIDFSRGTDEGVSKIASECHILDVMIPREKYADLPEWFETLKEASGICTLWVDSLREEGYEITRDFPFGVDKEAFHDFGSLIGIEPKVKAYLVGVPLTDLISSKLDEDFF